MTGLTLDRGERIVAVVPEHCSGPGWSNRVVWVYIESGNGGIRDHCLQIEDQTPEMLTLFDAAAVMHRALIDAVSVVDPPAQGG